MTRRVGPWELSEEDLVAWGMRIGRTSHTPAVICLRGDLGTGKTTLARAIARGAGVEGPVPSPTFNLLFRYPADRGSELVHIDLYRLREPDEVWPLGWSELPEDRELVIIEWPERAEELLPVPRWEIGLEEAADPLKRIISAERVGEAGDLPYPTDGHGDGREGEDGSENGKGKGEQFDGRSPLSGHRHSG